MKQVTKEKLKRRLDHLRGVLSDCEDLDEASIELMALFDSARDMQPMLCAAIVEQTGNEEWRFAYKEEIWSDEKQISAGTFLWPEELKER